MTRRYSVKEIFYTLQGEGAHAGRAAVFLRFAGCNLWSGREADRPAAVCRFCDTDFVGMNGDGGGRFDSPEALAAAVLAAWSSGAPRAFCSQLETSPRQKMRPEKTLERFGRSNDHANRSRAYVVCTGGEPALQLDAALIAALKDAGFEIAIETNGTLPVPDGIDWVCVSPKGAAPLRQPSGDELKLVYPQPEAEAQPEQFAGLDFQRFSLQPMDVIGDPAASADNMRRCAAYCMAHPQWRLTLQTHKIVGLP